MIIAACVKEGGRIIIKTAKDLSKDEVFELYQRVKKELEGENKGSETVLDVDTSSLPIGGGDSSEDSQMGEPAAEKAEPGGDGDDIGEILQNLGLGDDVPDQTGETAEAGSPTEEGDRESAMIDEILSSARPRSSAQGLQMNRKDKDLMSDGIKAPRYEDPKERGKREDARDPGAVRYKKNKEDRDPDVEGDKDLK